MKALLILKEQNMITKIWKPCFCLTVALLGMGVIISTLNTTIDLQRDVIISAVASIALHIGR
jgi:hypothetical protein